MLVAVAVAVLAVVAGGTPTAVLMLAIGMFAFQASIGALNDLTDVDRDRLVRPEKPIPAGLVTVAMARVIVVLGMLIGLTVSWLLGPAILGVGMIGLGAGFAYDVAPRRAVVGPLAFAVALPALIAWTWLAAAQMLPPGWPLLFAIAALAGPALHLANSMVDLEADRDAGATSLATVLGRPRGGIVLFTLDAVIWTIGWVSVAWLGPMSTFTLVALLLATALASIGLLLSLLPRTATSPAGWMVGAIALAILAMIWGASATS